MTPRTVLQKMRDGQVLPPRVIYDFARALGDGRASDAQSGAFAMAVCLQGLTPAARVALTAGMRDSGQVLTWDTDRPVIDKHSTGGIGDAVSLLLAPMLAAVGGYVPMISGRGLGHTGGTLDKLEAIPGVRTDVSLPKFQRIMGDTQCAIVAATPDLAPADRRLYAARDVTGTVRSVDLITASILSKKLAAGVQGLVLDVKTGRGAVMQDHSAAQMLSRSLVDVAQGAGCPTQAFVTNMDQPLVPAMGNAVEIAAVMQAFDTGQGRCVDVALTLGAAVLAGTGVWASEQVARQALQNSLHDGRALQVFGHMVAAQGGPDNFTDRWADYLDIAPAHPVRAPASGYVAVLDGTRLGHICVGLGAGRQTEGDRINPAVGLSDIAPLGAFVTAGQPLALIHAGDNSAQQAVAQCFTLTDAPPDVPPLIHDRITA
ncbi:MAG: thymidine phosphorylase [Pseudomonadota bacterium]